MARRVSRERVENFRFGGRQFQCLAFFLIVLLKLVLLLWLGSSVSLFALGFKESPKVIYSISPLRRVFDEALLKLPHYRLRRRKLTLHSACVQFLNHYQLLVIVLFVNPSAVKTDSGVQWQSDCSL